MVRYSRAPTTESRCSKVGRNCLFLNKYGCDIAKFWAQRNKNGRKC